MIIYQIGDYILGDHSHQIVNQVTISDSQVREFEAIGDFSTVYLRCKYVKAMVEESGNDFVDYYKRISQCGPKTHKESRLIQVTGNKLLISFLSFLKTFDDVISNSVSKFKGKEYAADFQKYKSEQYDNYLGYRFLLRMRNYVLHYDLPLSYCSSNTVGIEMFSVKDELLRYNGWSTIRSEIENMPEYISLSEYVSECKCQ